MHTDEAAHLLESKRYTRLLLRLGRWIAGQLEGRRCGCLQGPVRPFARKTLAKAHRDLLQEIDQARPGVMEDLHKVRIRGKKVRYAAEFFAALFDGDEAQAYLKTVEDLQDRLGAANDARVARLLVAELEYDRLGATTIDGIRAWSSRRVSRCLDQAEPVLHALQSASMFWQRR